MKYIQENTYKYNRTKKRKANDKSIKRHIAVSDNKIGRELSNFFGSVFELFLPETQAYSNRLQEIEREMKEEKEKEEREAAAKNNYYNSRWGLPFILGQTSERRAKWHLIKTEK